MPGEPLRPRRRPPKLPRIYTRDEVRALLAGALALRDWTSRHPCPIRSATVHAVILLLATSGLRISEALHLTLQDVDLAEGVLPVRQPKFRNYAEDAVMPSPVTVGVACGNCAQDSSA